MNLNPMGSWALVRYFLKLGALGFGGPIALAGYRQRAFEGPRTLTNRHRRCGRDAVMYDVI